MASRRAAGRLAKLWQLPLFLVSIGLFGYAAYLFIGPRKGITIPQRIEMAQATLDHGHFESALDQCNKILAIDKLKQEDEAHVHLLLSEILAGAQKDHHISLASNHEHIIEQIRQGLTHGGKPTPDIYRRLGESQEALDHMPEALAAYRQAIVLDTAKPLALQRKVIELQLTQPDPAVADESIEEYLKDKRLTDADRSWALCEKAQGLANRGLYVEANPVLDEALAIDPEQASQGVAHYWLGYCTWKLGDQKEAERVLRVARDQLHIKNTLDAEAAYLLGKIRQAQNDPREATSFYEVVLQSHPESRPAPLARLNRGVCRITLEDDPAALSDLHDVVVELGTKKNREAYMVEAVAGLKEASGALAAKGNLPGAIEAMEDEQSLVPEPPPEFFARLASILERRAEQVEQTLPLATDEPERSKIEEQVRKIRTQAGDSYIALSRGLTLDDDRGQGEAMRKGVDLYDRAGATQQSIDAMEFFVAERPDDGQTPDVLLRLGRAYQAIGQFDKAIKKFQQNQFRYPQSLAASRSGVPLAQSYIAKGPAGYPQAEKVLLAVLENNPILTPESEEFRLALFELAQLYYRTGRYEDAIGRLEETTQRYPNDPRMGQLVYLMADSYRKSAGLLAGTDVPAAAPTAQPPATVDAAGGAVVPNAMAVAAAKDEATAARRERLTKAKALFDRVIDLARTTPPVADLDKLYLKLSHFYRADCLYDLGQFAEAIKLYDAATLRYQDDPSAVAAYMQIVNAYCALGRFDEARTANERAKWLLRKMPQTVFEDAGNSMPKKYWEDWLRWTSESGMYSKDLKPAALTAAQ